MPGRTPNDALEAYTSTIQESLGFIYSLETVERREVLIYQWSPEGTGRTTRPHLHVGRRLLRESIEVGDRSVRLPKLHVPTGRVAIEDVVRFAIAELGVTPRRVDWKEVLDRNQLAFEEWKS